MPELQEPEQHWRVFRAPSAVRLARRGTPISKRRGSDALDDGRGPCHPGDDRALPEHVPAGGTTRLVSIPPTVE